MVFWGIVLWEFNFEFDGFSFRRAVWAEYFSKLTFCSFWKALRAAKCRKGTFSNCLKALQAKHQLI